MIDLPAATSAPRLALANVIAACAAMGKADGYNLNYREAAQGYIDWEQETYHDAPRIMVSLHPREPEPPRTGERAGGAAFRFEDEIHCVVHLRGDSSNIVDLALAVREDLFRALLTDRSRGLTRVWTKWRRCDIVYPVNADANVRGATVDAVLGVQWDCVAADMTTN